MGLASQLHEALLIEKKVPSAERFWAEIDKAPANKYISSTKVDWGSYSGRGQGKRLGGGMVRGAMSDGPRGIKTYSDILGKVKFKSKDDKEEAQMLEKPQQMMFAKALAAGYSNAVAFIVAYTVGRDAMERGEAYEAIKGLKD